MAGTKLGRRSFFDEQNMNDFNKPRTPEADIWKFVIDEADYAASNLPEVAKSAGRPSRYAALALKQKLVFMPVAMKRQLKQPV